MPSVKITRSFIDTIKPADKIVDYSDTEVKGLILRVKPSGNMVWRLNYRNSQKIQKRYTIGALEKFTVTQVKKEAQRLNGLIAQDKDIQETKQEKTETNILTLRKFIDEFYLQWYETHNKNIKSLLYYMGKPFEKILDKTMLELNDKKFITRFLTNYQNTNNSSNATYNRMLSTLKGIFSRAYEFGYIKSNAVRDVKLLKITTSKIRYLSETETRSFFEALPQLKNLHAQQIIEIAYYTGMRKNEILSLSFDDIDTQTNQITLKSSNTKSNKVRYIPIHKNINKILDSIDHKDGYLFVSKKTGTKYDNIDRSWKQLMKLSGIENFRFHDLRHNFCSMLVMNGVPIYTVAQLAGHADVKTTQIYAHLSPDVKKSAIDIL
ncbi:tyrosine-type recombinase/integrase [Francisella adeliensis]|uniref:Site-specific integrase n=1 Tax=Francisella adeliensis TaxID=2007306 RepID=A0A2Z4XZF4_9GAMM|nr:tyrosine-type recombinase/integrase [Francisella adeliensis]AXA34150.1 hypothetical protein CDH04_06925 [Francisella adeliensis]MBK2086438.1 site-specific integrase [Francisella adeliensis]MBK2096337.1 site-specific integrase [Francisella adeliensis]QIW12395.1 site-specific integrase [Francisella adeliensis]QIW14269.1 site-specific integrase [Francisella adeliensis]